MSDILLPAELLPSHLEQSGEVRARFDKLKQREVILTVSHLNKVFQSGEKSTLALHDISFTTHRREFLCVVGPSGCGKSTLLRIVAGLLPASAGRVEIDGAVHSGPVTELGIVFQQPVLLDWRT